MKWRKCRETEHFPYNTLALCADRGREIWATVLRELAGPLPAREGPAPDEACLRRALFETLPAMGIPAAQVLGVAEGLRELIKEALMFRYMNDAEAEASRRALDAVTTDARRASALATALGRATGARTVNWCRLYRPGPGDDRGLKGCAVYVVTGVSGGSVQLEADGGPSIGVAVGRWAAGRARPGDRFHLEMLADGRTPRLARIAAVAPVASRSTAPAPVPGERGFLGMAQTVRVRVQLDRCWGVWRELELRGGQTLNHLHCEIQGAFGWDEDHPHAFFLGRNRHDREAEYACQECRDAEHHDDVTLSSLGLRRGRVFWYLFDFGDRLWHSLRVTGIGEPQRGVSYPRLVESKGEAPDQYGAVG